ncbi:MAG: 4Fe-4S dicluster domain-containing protein [Promethearchaeia archaeon]
MADKAYSDSEWTDDFLKELMDDVEDNKNLVECTVCGKCVGECPAAIISNFNSRNIIMKVLKGDRSVVKEPDIWFCFLCEKCKRLCPREGINIPLLIINLRNESFKKGYGPRYNDLRKYVEMADRFLTKGVVVEDPLEGAVSEERINELDEICNFARIKYVFKAGNHYNKIHNLNKKKNKKKEKNNK